MAARKSNKSKQQKEEDELVEEDVQSESDDSEDNSDNDASESDSESEGDEDVAASLFNRQAEDEDESDDDSDGDDSMEDNNAPSSSMQVEAYTFDLRNMLAINTDQLAIGTFYDTKKSKDANENNIEIPLDPVRGKSLGVNEEYLLSKATDGCTKLIQSLWTLPTEMSDAGPLVTLPTYDEIRLPRAMVCINVCVIFFFCWPATPQSNVF